ncbi:MAG: threonine aldolase family protein [Solirubrobacteraceae bacterium]
MRLTEACGGVVRGDSGRQVDEPMAGARRVRVDLSSDTATRPTPAMRRCIAAAEVGDEQRREDPTVLALEEHVAELCGQEAAVFLPSGTMCNIVAFFVHCRPGDEVILDRLAHPAVSENAGPAVHSRVSLMRLEAADGVFTGTQVERALQPVGHHTARTSMISVENTSNRRGGTIWSRHQIDDVLDAARRNGLHAHLDGARLFNAAVGSGVSVASLGAGFLSVFVDLSKGLGCPMGAVLSGSAGFVEEARWAKHLFGGALRQAGIAAAAGLYALRHHVDRLADDHALARRFAAGIEALPGVALAQSRVDSNIVQFRPDGDTVSAEQIVRRMEARGIRLGLLPPDVIRVVTHLDVASEDIEQALSGLRAELAPQPAWRRQPCPAARSDPR